MKPDATGFLALDKVSYAYPGRQAVVRSVSLAIGAGEIHGLIGRSGCGKTTLLKLAAGLLKPEAGRIQLQGHKVEGPGASMGFVFQSPTLLEWLDVLDNVLLPHALHGQVSSAQREQALQLIGQLGLSGLGHRFPSQLSGGQQSRVAIARALITAPPILFMDEPFAALDAITRGELQRDFLAFCQSLGTSVLFVTHDIAEAVYMADHVSVIQAGEVSRQLAIDLPRPRPPALRYTPEFNALCAQLRIAMEEHA